MNAASHVLQGSLREVLGEGDARNHQAQGHCGSSFVGDTSRWLSRNFSCCDRGTVCCCFSHYRGLGHIFYRWIAFWEEKEIGCQYHGLFNLGARKQACYTFPFFQHCSKVTQISKLLQRGRVKARAVALVQMKRLSMGLQYEQTKNTITDRLQRLESLEEDLAGYLDGSADLGIRKRVSPREAPASANACFYLSVNRCLNEKSLIARSDLSRLIRKLCRLTRFGCQSRLRSVTRRV